ncbi:hypothetical protein ACR9E3_11905 [Actinomycetospora sp. C-140]
MLDHAPPFPGDLAEALGFPPVGDRQWDAIAGSGADSVEIKILLTPGVDTATLLSGTHAVRVRHRRLHLLDTDDLALARAGVHLRLRDRGRDRWDLTVRLRGSGTGAVPDLPRPAGGRVELDVLPGAVFHSSEVRERVPAGLAIALRDGVLDPRELLTGPQAALLAHGVPDLDGELWAHGPLRVERASVPRPRCRLPHARHERCRFPGGRVLEEFSARCLPAEAPEVARASAYLLAAHRLTAAESQRTKTAVWADELLAGVR